MSGDLRIRLATRADAVAIANLSRTEIERDLRWRWTPARVVEAMRDPATNVAVAERAGSVAGFGIMAYDDEVADLHLLAVRPADRRRGVGGALLAWLEQVALAAGVTRFRLEARLDNVAALRFYRKHGYREHAEVPGLYDGREDGVRLEKSILAGEGDPS